MREITQLRAGEDRRKQKVKVFLDDRYAFSLDTEVIVKENLQVGQELSNGRIEALVKSDQFHRCYNVASRYLSYRPRSESEIRGRLQQRGFDGEFIEAVVAKLMEQGLVDDFAFAQFWKDNRESFSPRSQRLTKLELRRKGINGDIIEQVIEEVDDVDSAYRAALKKVRLRPLVDYQSFRRWLGEYLRRRGFSYDVINSTVERIWQEQGNSSG
ncbi:MAG: RecX family transcriptional regulator [Dehalococcoidales bacterium]